MGNDDSCADKRVLVIINGTFGTAFRKGVRVASDVVIFTPVVDDHQYTINNEPFDGEFRLHGVQSSPNRCLQDYDLEGRVFTIDTKQYPIDPTVKPHAWIYLGYPKHIVPHRMFNFAFRDGATAGPHVSAVPCALVMEYSTDSPQNVFATGPCGRVDPQPFGDNQYCFYLLAGGLGDRNDDYLIHARNAWRQFASHCDGLSCEIFAAMECDCEKKLKDRFRVSDYDIETVPHAVSAPNCKNQHTFMLNGTTETVIWH